MSTKDAIAKGIGAYGMWKQRLIKAIESGVSEWTPDIVCQDNQCAFGKWLYSCTPEERASAHFNNVKELHAQFHRSAAKVLTLALEHKKEAAEKEIGPGSEYASKSHDLTKEMMAWQSSL